jgi:site-specific recombinase XerD
MEKTFEQYLMQLRHSRGTIKSYLYAADIFLSLCPNAEAFNYKEVVSYMSERVKAYKNIKTPSAFLAAVKKYYDYLIDIGRRNDHPCRTLNLKSGKRNREVIHADLFSSKELEQLMEREERYADLKLRNQVLVSLLIYQGLTASELVNLMISHVDLDNGTVFIKESRTLTRRHLDLQPKQYRLLDRYITEARKALLRTETNALLLGKLGKPLTTDEVNYLIETFKSLFPDRNLNPSTIRQSVIANWLNEKKLPLEHVQLIAGHKWISTTAKYRQTSIGEQRELVNKWFPVLF